MFFYISPFLLLRIKDMSSRRQIQWVCPVVKIDLTSQPTDAWNPWIRQHISTYLFVLTNWAIFIFFRKHGAHLNDGLLQKISSAKVKLHSTFTLTRTRGRDFVTTCVEITAGFSNTLRRLTPSWSRHNKCGLHAKRKKMLVWSMIV